jgi:hypothetical protein
MQKLLTGLAEAVAARIHEAASPLAARIAALEAAVGIVSKAAPPALEHKVGEVVVYSGMRFKCVAPNRYRAIEDEDRAA